VDNYERSISRACSGDFFLLILLKKNHHFLTYTVRQHSKKERAGDREQGITRAGWPGFACRFYLAVP
jgi:hypothetical protein